MEFFKLSNGEVPCYLLKSIRVMRIGLFLIFIVIAQLRADEISSQNVVINLSLKNATVEQVLDQIEKDTDFSFYLRISL